MALVALPVVAIMALPEAYLALVLCQRLLVVVLGQDQRELAEDPVALEVVVLVYQVRPALAVLVLLDKVLQVVLVMAAREITQLVVEAVQAL